MPTYSYTCTACGERFDAYKPMAERKTHDCPECGATAKQRMVPVNFDNMSMGCDPAMPTSSDKFDRMMRQQTEKEKKAYREHGDYGPAPGSD